MNCKKNELYPDISPEKYQEELISMLLREFTQAIGICPGNIHSWKHPNGCREFCNAINCFENYSKEIALCWRVYFEEKIAGKVGKSGT